MPSHSNPRARGGRFPGAAWPLAIASLVLLPLAAAAQEDKLPPPDGWLTRTDHGGDGVEALQEMPPGWHVTTGPAGIFYDPETRADGDFRVESTVFLFDPEGRNEGFGVFIGGADLQGDGQAYTYLLIRADGSVIVKRRDGDETSTLLEWTKHEAVVAWAARGEGAATAKNVLFVEAGGEEVVFGVNEQEVFRTARTGQHVDGVVGLRVNHGLNLHFSSLEVTDG
ncbi:hypothetical protein [Candidatus Palauibacter soopunensis]|uniref:hypothetical protein n=1 Tax=Candidatus Palauibacter soopunensis TaxID=3056739 RepID=UPI00239CEFEB|nr:hypothetical protein [Candidatus Palauibacter soopunensis]MDE2878552.1 hypothetical protein [Candidatus Palauibacter soopunensis]